MTAHHLPTRSKRCCASPCPTRARSRRRPPRSCARPATASATTPRSSRSSTPRTASSSSTCARATSRCTSARARSTSASPAATCCSTPAPRPTRRCRSASGAAASASPAPPGRYTDLAELAGLRIATSYVGVVEAFLAERGIEATVIRLDGAVETSIQLGVADVIADVVETGSTLRQAGLEVFGELILESEAVADHPRRRRRRRRRSRSSCAASRASWSRAAT